MTQRIALSLMTLAVSSSLLACGECPPSRYEPARPETTEARSYELGSDGSLSVTTGSSGAPKRMECGETCTAAFADPAASCQQTCNLLSGYSDIPSCAFDETHTVLDCTIHQSAQDEQCNCDIIDC
jgi:hypothetical protein